jgi:hypothetical protein
VGPGSGIGENQDPGSGINIPDPQHWIIDTVQIVKTVVVIKMEKSSVGDPDLGSGIGCLFDPWIRDPGWVESQYPDPGSGMNNPDHIF